jgi:hypothetical protein
MTRLRDLGTWAGGNTPSKANPAYWIDGTVPWVSPKDMKVDEIVSSEDHITKTALDDGRVSLITCRKQRRVDLVRIQVDLRIQQRTSHAIHGIGCGATGQLVRKIR